MSKKAVPVKTEDLKEEDRIYLSMVKINRLVQNEIRRCEYLESCLTSLSKNIDESNQRKSG